MLLLGVVLLACQNGINFNHGDVILNEVKEIYMKYKSLYFMAGKPGKIPQRTLTL